MKLIVGIFLIICSLLLPVEFINAQGKNKPDINSHTLYEYSTVNNSSGNNEEKPNSRYNESSLNSKKSIWAETFEPSEKIDADSVISFPVDI